MPLWLVHRFVLVVVPVALLVTPLGGCRSAALRIQLPGFGWGNDDGVWLWRLSSSGYVRACRYDLSDSYTSGSQEMVSYVETCLDGTQPIGPWLARVERSPSDPLTVTLVLYCALSAPLATYKASAFNQAGESPLSSSVIAM